MFVLGTFAYPGSGQDVFARELARRLNIHVYSLGDFFRNIAKERNILQTRENLQKLRKEIDKKHHKSFIPRKLAAEIILRNEPAIITGIRLKEEVEVFNCFFQFKLVFVFAESSIRYQRLINRKEEKDPTTHEEYRIQCQREEAMFDLDYLETVSDCNINCNLPKKLFLENFEDTINVMGEEYKQLIMSIQDSK